MRIWNLSQTAGLERQTLVKLATTSDQWLPGGTNLDTDARSRLWWLLNDMVQEECYFQIRQPTNGNSESFFAIRLNEAQADQWLTNLPVVLEPLTGAHAVANPEQHGWSVKTADNLIELTRVGDWTVIGVGPQNNLFSGEITTRIRRDGVPFISAGTNLWLEASLDLPRAAKIFHISAGNVSAFDHLNLTLTGDGGNVITRAKLTFSKPFSAPLESWRLPVDLMHEPLAGFTAVRGLQSWLAAWPPWHDSQLARRPINFSSGRSRAALIKFISPLRCPVPKFPP